MDIIYSKTTTNTLSNNRLQVANLIEDKDYIESKELTTGDYIEDKELTIEDKEYINIFKYIDNPYNNKSTLELMNLLYMINFMNIEPSFNIVMNYTDTTDGYGFIEFMQNNIYCAIGHTSKINKKVDDYVNLNNIRFFYDDDLNGDLRYIYIKFINFIKSTTQVGTSIVFSSIIKSENIQVRTYTDKIIQFFVGLSCCRHTQILSKKTISGGNYIVKIEDIESIITPLYIVSQCFEFFDIFKPATLDVFNDHLYIVFINKKPKSEVDIYLNYLKRYLDDKIDIDIEEEFISLIDSVVEKLNSNKNLLVNKYIEGITYDVDVASYLWKTEII